MIRELPVDNATQQYFQEHALGWDDRMPPNYSDILYDFALPLASEFRAARTILEIGTGTGSLIPVLHTLAPESKLVSIDFAYAMIAQAYKRCPNAHLLQADVHNLPVANSEFDLVICHNSFPHFSDKSRALYEIARILHPNGKLMILHNNSREFVNTIHQRAGAPINHDVVPTKDEMHHLLTSTGWSAVEVDDASTHYIARAQRGATS